MGSMMMKDPFADDPFFSNKGGSLFGQMDKMMKDMRSNMNNAMELHEGGMSMGGNGGLAQGRFMKQSVVQTTKMGPDGRPHKESY